MKAVAVVCLLLAASVAAQNTFCERYAAALFGSSTAATQQTLLTAAVTGTVAGRMGPKGPGLLNNVTGLLNSPLNKPYFNGEKAPKIDYTKDAAAYGVLADHLIKFFGSALGCVAYSTANPYTAVDLKVMHAAMEINAAVYNDFVGNLVATLTSYGVAGTVGPNDDLTGPAALLGMFLKGSKAEICSAADCPAWNDYLHFMADDATFWVKGSADKSMMGNLLPGGAVHFDLTALDNIVQADSATAVTAMAGGKTSGAVGATRSYTIKLDTVGTYWFYSAKAPATKRATVVVALSAGFASSSVSFMAVALAALFAFVAQRV